MASRRQVVPAPRPFAEVDQAFFDAVQVAAAPRRGAESVAFTWRGDKVNAVSGTQEDRKLFASVEALATMAMQAFVLEDDHDEVGTGWVMVDTKRKAPVPTALSPGWRTPDEVSLGVFTGTSMVAVAGTMPGNVLKRLLDVPSLHPTTADLLNARAYNLDDPNTTPPRLEVVSLVPGIAYQYGAGETAREVPPVAMPDVARTIVRIGLLSPLG